ncbi:Sodium/hydrogen exchanger family-domain-containing protein [Boletus reticuloceps]|uniref:Sodium/hydrogen exchanger family-domain-containing protein n=1 Tax=Boletus reticuloceps TaxID=495285 RepID=A0A8I2YQ22_9AGAM|nr:Sodium/hydrogen exchanger family-domain-containing protein [Boletus reticuloceps]
MSSFSLSSRLSRREATGEGGLITGTNPAAFTTSDPLRLWIIQVGIIIVMAQLLSLVLRKLRQPKVIAEVLGGILLGPTAFGRIPGFTDSIFPPVSLPYLSLVANIGLCLFLFLVGLEIDANVVARNARMSAVVSLAGIALPFGLGSILSIPLYHHFIDPSVHFTYFMLFTGVAYSITAFPVLCRVLAELKLLDTNVGIIVLSAGVGNDIIGWTLLALSVALVNAGSGLTALWILLVCIAFTIFLLLPVKFVMRWLARKTGSIENGPTMFYMTVVMILVWACAFFTDSIGVNAIFGAFLAGLVVPREGGLAITLTEKLEDMVSIVFLPLYFTLSGLNTNLGLLDNGITWAFTIAIIAFSFAGKFGGCTIAARVSGYGWRESSTVGALMSCKGLVELIVLNVGLQAGILSPRVFSMFVLETLTLTFMTTPLVMALYPPERRLRVGEAARPAGGDERGQHDEKASIINEEQPWRHRFTVVLDKLDHIPSAMALTQLVLPPLSPPSDIMSTTTKTEGMDKRKIPEMSVEALQLIELSDRTSAMMKSSVADSLLHTDPVLGIFRMFGELNELAVTTSLSVVPHDDFAHSIAQHALRHASHLVLLPWLPPTAPAVADTPDTATSWERVAGGKGDKSPSDIHSQFVRGVFAQSKTDVALFIDTGDRMGARVGVFMHVFLPFFGGPDDRLALAFVVQLCLNPRMTATVVRMTKRDVVTDAGEGLERPSVVHLEDKAETGLRAQAPLTPRGDGPTVTSTIAMDTIYGRPTTETRMHSDTADNFAWSKYAHPLDTAHADNSAMRHALSRIHFSDAQSPAPLHTALRQARTLRETTSRLLIVAGRSRRLAKECHHGEMKRLLETYYRPGIPGVEGMRKTIGDVGTAMVLGGSAGAVVVLQAADIAVA